MWRGFVQAPGDFPSVPLGPGRAVAGGPWSSAAVIGRGGEDLFLLILLVCSSVAHGFCLYALCLCFIFFEFISFFACSSYGSND